MLLFTYWELVGFPVFDDHLDYSLVLGALTDGVDLDVLADGGVVRVDGLYSTSRKSLINLLSLTFLRCI